MGTIAGLSVRGAVGTRVGANVGAKGVGSPVGATVRGGIGAPVGAGVGADVRNGSGEIGATLGAAVLGVAVLGIVLHPPASGYMTRRSGR